MSSIGPQLPPHLAKRKRTPDDQERDSPPAKQIRNTDEVELDDGSSDDGYGPTIPGAKLPTHKPSIGPTRPANDAEISLDAESSDDDYGPPAPAPTSQKPSKAPSPPPKRVLGPAPPPADLASRPPRPPSPDSSSDSDYGPALPSSRTSQARVLNAQTAAAALAARQAPEGPKRDDWMMAPPSDTGYHERDPTKLKNRKFATGRTGGAPDRGGGISSIWTETPEEKRKRLEDAVLGRGTESETVAAPRRERSRRDEEHERRIREYTDQARGKSLYEEHQAAKKTAKGDGPAEEEEDDPSKRAFDREKDMALGGKIGNAQRRELLSKAKDFGGRFQKGSYL